MQTQHAGSPKGISFSNASPLVVDTFAASPRRLQVANLRAASPVVVPSLLLCDFGHLADEVHKLEAAGARAFHLDVMDGHFVPNLTYGLPIVEAVRRITKLPIEAHLMISDPTRYAERFVAAGADAVTFHIEAVDNPRPLLAKLRSLGAVAGLAYNPHTPLSAITEYLDACDLVLTMSVSPGFGGQAFQSVALEKIRQLSTLVGKSVLLEVDGGVNADTIGPCAEAGAQLYVVGSAIFSQPDYGQSLATLTHLAKTHSRTH
ncbi:MAG: ribulose-phosphate 3-epimerase [Planctomycetia bacterium]|nr:ribulose-phosphate 3-epimerase [Planctomycetia bacterium]